MTGKEYKIITDNLGEYSVLRPDGSIVSTEIQNKARAELFCDELNELLKEKDELKQQLNDLQTFDDEDFIEIEYINNIYKKLGFQGVIDYAKDNLQQYGAVREVEKGLWVMVTGGWSEHEMWLDCLNSFVSMFGMKHYCAYELGGAFYYTEKPHDKIEIILKGDDVE